MGPMASAPWAAIFLFMSTSSCQMSNASRSSALGVASSRWVCRARAMRSSAQKRLTAVGRGRGVEAECSGDADGGCAADDHVGDGVGVLLDVVEGYPVFALWERELIDDGERLGLVVPSEWADVGLCDGLHGESSFEKGKKKASL